MEKCPERSQKHSRASFIARYVYREKVGVNAVNHPVQKSGMPVTPRPPACSTAKVQHRVLLIEDSEEAAFLVRQALQDFGNGKYILEWVRTLSDGLARLAEGKTDIVLLDLGLPETSGPTSYTRLRKIAPEVPVVVLSGDTTEETQVSVIIGGVQDYLVKEQVTGPLLMEAVRSALFANRRR